MRSWPRARQAGRDFLLGDTTGLGKTLSVWSAVAAMPEREVLIVCPKGAMPQWRRTIALSGLGEKAVTLDQLRAHQGADGTAPRRATAARPAPRTTRSPGTARRSGPGPWWSSTRATASGIPTPSRASSAGRSRTPPPSRSISAPRPGRPRTSSPISGACSVTPRAQPTETLAEFRALMQRLGIGRAKGRWTNWSWDANPRDCTVMADLLFKGERAIGLRRRPGDIAGWPEVQRALSAVALSPAERRLYDATWREFRREWGLARRQHPQAGRVGGGPALPPEGEPASGLGHHCLRRPPDGGRPTGGDLGGFPGDGRRPGRGAARRRAGGPMRSPARNRARPTRRRGSPSRPASSTPSSSPSPSRSRCTQGEMPGGEKPRALIVHDLRHSAIQLAQIEGRCHRDGQQATIYYALAEGTVEESIAATVVGRMASMDAMAGEDTDAHRRDRPGHRRGAERRGRLSATAFRWNGIEPPRLWPSGSRALRRRPAHRRHEDRPDGTTDAEPCPPDQRGPAPWRRPRRPGTRTDAAGDGREHPRDPRPRRPLRHRAHPRGRRPGDAVRRAGERARRPDRIRNPGGADRRGALRRHRPRS